MEVKQSAVAPPDSSPSPAESGTLPEPSGLDLDANHSLSSSRSPGRLPELFFARLTKSWARALDIPVEAVEALRACPLFTHLEPLFEIGRDLRLVGGAVEFAVDDSGKFIRYVLSDWSDHVDANQTREKLVRTLVESIPEESLSDTFFDYDRIPRDHSRFSETRLRREVMRAIRDELFPATVSAMLGHLGSPLGRGDAGFDISCIRGNNTAEDQIIEQVQVKILRDDSPILNPQSPKGMRQLWKLITSLRESSEQRIIPKALILEQGVCDDKMAGLEARLLAAGIDRAQIIVLDEVDLRACGFQIKEVRCLDGNVYPLRIRVELQAFMRACCAAEFLGREEPIYRTPDTDALTNAFQRFVPQDEARALAERLAARGPLEVQLLQSYGIWPLKSLLETSRVFLRRQAA